MQDKINWYESVYDNPFQKHGRCTLKVRLKDNSDTLAMHFKSVIMP